MIRRCVLSEASTLLWRMGYAPTAARLICAAQTVADKKRCPVVLVAADGVELRTFEPRDAAASSTGPARRRPASDPAEVVQSPDGEDPTQDGWEVVRFPRRRAPRETSPTVRIAAVSMAELVGGAA